MATPAELAFERTNLDEEQLAHLQRLLGHLGDPGRPVLLRPRADGADGPRARPTPPGGPRAGHPRPDAPVEQLHGRRARPGRPDGRRRRLAAGGPGLRDRGVVAGRDGARARRRAGPAALHPGAVRGGDGGRPGPDVGRRRPAARATWSAPTGTCSTASPSCCPRGRSRSRARRWPPRRRPGSGTAWSWSTRRAGSATPRPTPPTPSTGWACTPRSRAAGSPTSGSRSRPSSGRWPRRCPWWRRSSAVRT